MAVGTKVGAIRYPFARGRAGAIFILEYTKGTPVTCFGCDRPLVAKQGRRNRWHFAHAVDTNVTCNAETALHRLSKVLVQDGFTYALTNQQPYLLRWRCPSCGEPHVVDATRWWTRVATESSAIIGTRSDVMFEGQRPIAVEIVVTHDVEDETAARYVNADLPVFIVRPRWETVGSLRAELVADDALIVRSEKCPTCREQIETERRHQARLDVLRQRLDEVRMIDDRIVEQRLSDWPPEVDRFGRTLYEGVRRAVADQAIRLMMIGFTQMQKNRWCSCFTSPAKSAPSMRASAVPNRSRCGLRRHRNSGFDFRWMERTNDMARSSSSSSSVTAFASTSNGDGISGRPSLIQPDRSRSLRGHRRSRSSELGAAFVALS